MITDAFMTIIGDAVELIASLFPTSAFNPIALFASAIGVIGGIDYFFPMHELATVVVGFLQIGVPFMAVQLVLWLVALLRGGNASA